ncbi:MAG: hypothetical protein HOH50_17235 [Planctomycetaceae bacterium]|nr:hypothetical protein [Planctomycetaceae bacterium]
MGGGASIMICILFIQVKLNQPEKLSGTRSTNDYYRHEQQKSIGLLTMEAANV